MDLHIKDKRTGQLQMCDCCGREVLAVVSLPGELGHTRICLFCVRHAMLLLTTAEAAQDAKAAQDVEDEQ